MLLIKAQLGEQDTAFATSLNHLAEVYRDMGRYAQAEPLYQQALAIRKQQLGGQHLDYAVSLFTLADLYQSQGRNTQAEPLLEQTLAIFK